MLVKAPTTPVPALISDSEIAEAVIDAAVETYVRSPIPCVPDVDAITPTPVARSPQHSNRWGHHPRAGHPVVTIWSPRPVTRRPDVVGPRTNRLRVNRDRRRRHRDRNAYAHVRWRRNRYQQRAEH